MQALTSDVASPACSLRGYAQRDPLVEYKLEGYNLFVEMMAQVRCFRPWFVAAGTGSGCVCA